MSDSTHDDWAKEAAKEIVAEQRKIYDPIMHPVPGWEEACAATELGIATTFLKHAAPQLERLAKEAEEQRQRVTGSVVALEFSQSQLHAANERLARLEEDLKEASEGRLKIARLDMSKVVSDNHGFTRCKEVVLDTLMNLHNSAASSNNGRASEGRTT